MKIILPSKFALTLLMFCLSQQTKAQGDASNLLKGGVSDANILLNGYFNPVLKSFGSSLNNGWYNTARPHGTLGFDITVCANLAIAPTADLTFPLSGLTILKPQANATVGPSVFGSNNEGAAPIFDINLPNPSWKLFDSLNPGGTNPFSKDTTLAGFRMPAGMGINIFGSPSANIALGIYKNTEIIIRYVPKIKQESFEVGLWGFGIKHDIKQWIPVIKAQKIWDIAGFFGYTQFNSILGLDELQPDAPYGSTSPNGNIVNNNTKPTSTQQISIHSTAWNAQLLVSAKLLFFTPYAGFGYQRATTDLTVEGQYPFTTFIMPGEADFDPNIPTKKRVNLTEKDPVKITGTISGFRATFGARINLAILTLHADYTFAAYNMLTAGVGINFQSFVPFKP
ncbi:MAG: DUF6588 family protein [Bacteroidota bacterium]